MTSLNCRLRDHNFAVIANKRNRWFTSPLLRLARSSRRRWSFEKKEAVNSFGHRPTHHDHTERNKTMDPAATQLSKPTRIKPSILNRVLRKLALILIISIGGLYFLSMTSSRPDNLGVAGGKLAKCPSSPNCVSSQAETPEHQMPAIPFQGQPDEMIAKIKQYVESEFPRAKLVSEFDHYLHYEFKSLIFRFVDDVEFLVDDKDSTVQFRSASRVGHSDLGVNRKRMEKISESLKQ